jgi:nitrate/nitrite transporter NarK
LSSLKHLFLDSYIAKWFLGTELSLALGISVGGANLGSAFASILQPMLYKINYTCDYPLLISAILMGFGILK